MFGFLFIISIYSIPHVSDFNNFTMNNKFWREIFDQITSLVMVFRMKEGASELMFVNKAVQSNLGYTPEAFVMESEQEGALRSGLSELIDAVIGGSRRVVLTDLSGMDMEFSVEIQQFFSDAIREELAVLTLHKGTSDGGNQQSGHDIVADSIVMQSVIDRFRQVDQAGASMAFIGSQGTGKRLFMDTTLRGALSSGSSIWKMDYATSKNPIYIMDGVQVDLDAMFAMRLRRQVVVLIYELDRMPKSDQLRLKEFADGQDGLIRFITGSLESPDVLVSSGALLPELYYKLNVISIVLPPLDMRRADIRPFAERWMERVVSAAGMEQPVVSDKEWSRLFHHAYVNGFDELVKILKDSLLGWNGDKFQFILAREATTTAKSTVRTKVSGKIELDPTAGHDEHMMDYLRQVMEINDWKIYGKDGAASALGMKPTTLQSKLEKYGVKKS